MCHVIFMYCEEYFVCYSLSLFRAHWMLRLLICLVIYILECLNLTPEVCVLQETDTIITEKNDN